MYCITCKKIKMIEIQSFLAPQLRKSDDHCRSVGNKEITGVSASTEYIC